MKWPQQFSIWVVLFFYVALFGTCQNARARETTFSWEMIEGAASYEIQIGKSKHFKKKIAEQKTTDVRWTLDLPIGRYLYRVRGIDSDNQPGIWSEAVEVDIQPYSPDLVSPKADAIFKYYEIPQKIKFEWVSAEPTTKYEIFIYYTNGKKALEQKSSKPEFTTAALTKGEYFWKVKALSGKKMESLYSEPRKFRIDQMALEKPKMTDPPANSIHHAYRQIEFKWDMDEHAKYSDLELKSPESSQNWKLLEQDSIKVSSLDPGEYLAKVLTKEGPATPGVISGDHAISVRNDLVSDGQYGFRIGYIPRFQIYEIETTRTGTRTSMTRENKGAVLSLMGYRFLTEGIGLQLDMESGTSQTDTWNLPVYRADLSLRLRFGIAGFNNQFYVGVRHANFFEVLPGTIATYNLIRSSGVVAGNQMIGTLTPRLRLHLEAQWSKPINTLEAKGTIDGDSFGATLGVGWNFHYRYWVTAMSRFQQDVIRYGPLGLSGSPASGWTQRTVEPIYLSIGFEY